jgi:hypothetical protein
MVLDEAEQTVYMALPAACCSFANNIIVFLKRRSAQYEIFKGPYLEQRQ